MLNQITAISVKQPPPPPPRVCTTSMYYTCAWTNEIGLINAVTWLVYKTVKWLAKSRTRKIIIWSSQTWSIYSPCLQAKRYKNKQDVSAFKRYVFIVYDSHTVSYSVWGSPQAGPQARVYIQCTHVCAWCVHVCCCTPLTWSHDNRNKLFYIFFRLYISSKVLSVFMVLLRILLSHVNVVVPSMRRACKKTTFMHHQ